MTDDPMHPNNLEGPSMHSVGARVAEWIARGIGHIVGTISVAALFAIPLVEWRTVELYVQAVRDPHFHAAWGNIAAHLGVAAATWALAAIGFHHIRRRSRKRRHTESLRGSVMVETLIVIVPFLLLVSGLAQLSLRNVAGILADLAVYQGTRTAWIWEPEFNTTRNPNNRRIQRQFIRRRARLASAGVLAPTAPSDFTLDNPGDPELRNMRATMHATFSGKAGLNAGRNHRRSARTALRGGAAPRQGENQTFARAFDSDPFRERASRKLTFAYLALQNYQVDLQGPISVRFRYRFNVVFPWFAYIFGGNYSAGNNVPGGRAGWYVNIQRPRPGVQQNQIYSLTRQTSL